eukprot:12453036-Ditylum_brightwellii.AAC.1
MSESATFVQLCQDVSVPMLLAQYEEQCAKGLLLEIEGSFILVRWKMSNGNKILSKLGIIKTMYHLNV